MKLNQVAESNYHWEKGWVSIIKGILSLNALHYSEMGPFKQLVGQIKETRMMSMCCALGLHGIQVQYMFNGFSYCVMLYFSALFARLSGSMGK